MTKMRRVQQKVIILIISSVLCALFLHVTWRECGGKPNDKLASMAIFSWLSWESRESQNNLVGPQFLHLESQERRKANVRSVCKENNLTVSSFVLDHNVARQLFVEHSHKFIYCEVPKVGCSNWKRIILLLNKSHGLSANELVHEKVHTSNLLIRLSSYPRSLQKEFLANYTKVMFTRDPLERIVSAYRDKFLHDDNFYYSKIVVNEIREKVGNDSESDASISFEKFARFIITEKPYHRDIHWKPAHELCDPCNIKYDFIGKFETLAHDADIVLRTIGAPQDLKYPTIKHHSNESRTTDDISIHFLEMLSPILFRKFMNIYSLDFSMFEYSYYNSTVSKNP